MIKTVCAREERMKMAEKDDVELVSLHEYINSASTCGKILLENQSTGRGFHKTKAAKKTAIQLGRRKEI